MANIIVGVIIAIAVISAIVYLIRAKHKGNKCIGCPYSGSCDKHCR